MDDNTLDQPAAEPHDAAAPEAVAAEAIDAEPATAAEAARGLFSARPMLFPNAYAWLMLFSALDIMLTWIILHRPDGIEANPVARAVIERFGLDGMIVYKFALVMVFVLLCEVVGRLRRPSGRVLSRVGVGIAAFPVVWSMWLLFRAGQA